MTDAEFRDQAVAELRKTTVGYLNKHWTTPPAGTHWANALALLAQIGATPPPSGWVVAAPGSTGKPIQNIEHPVGAGVNVYQASQPMAYADIVVTGGTDNSFLVQPGAPGRTFQRIQSILAVEDGQSTPGDNKHAFYVKAANITVLDYAATAAPQADGGLSVRYAGFLGQRVTLDNFQLPLCVFADDEVKGSVTWRQVAITNPRNTPVYLDVDEAAKMVYDIVLDQVAVTGAPTGLKFLAANPATFAGTATISACTFNGQPVTTAMVQGVPSSVLRIT